MEINTEGNRIEGSDGLFGIELRVVEHVLR